MRTCIVCRCTDDMACINSDGACHWSRAIGKNAGVCSACPDPAPLTKLTPAQRVRRRVLTGHVATTDVRRRKLLEQVQTSNDVYESAIENLREFEHTMAGT